MIPDLTTACTRLARSLSLPRSRVMPGVKHEVRIMSASTVNCYILGGNVRVVSDLNGKVTNVICEHFVRLNHIWGIKAQQFDAPLSGALSAAVDCLTGSRSVFCEFTEPWRIFSKK